MSPRAALLVALLALLAQDLSLSFKTSPELKQQYRRVENEEFSTSDRLVGKAMDLIYSNRTVMSLIARELWNVGSRAIDKIVELKGDKGR